jgi:hypothetical protein
MSQDQMTQMCQTYKYDTYDNSLPNNRITNLTVGLNYIIT